MSKPTKELDEILIHLMAVTSDTTVRNIKRWNGVDVGIQMQSQRKEALKNLETYISKHYIPRSEVEELTKEARWCEDFLMDKVPPDNEWHKAYVWVKRKDDYLDIKATRDKD